MKVFGIFWVWKADNGSINSLGKASEDVDLNEHEIFTTPVTFFYSSERRAKCERKGEASLIEILRRGAYTKRPWWASRTRSVFKSMTRKFISTSNFWYNWINSWYVSIATCHAFDHGRATSASLVDYFDGKFPHRLEEKSHKSVGA